MELRNASLVPSDTALKEIVAEYRRLRPTKLRLSNLLVKRLSSEILREGAKRLGILRNGIFEFDTEDQSAVLMDYCIFDVRFNGLNAVDQYLAETPPTTDPDEALQLQALQGAKYGKVVVLAVKKGIGCVIEDLYTDEQHLLIDMGLSQTAEPGLLLATRLLNFGRYYTTGGAALPMGVLMTEEQLDAWRERLAGSDIDENGDPAPLIRTALSKGASQHVQYADGVVTPQSNVQSAVVRRDDLAARKRVLSKLTSAKSVRNERCPCGSGKKYKNCCMKGR